MEIYKSIEYKGYTFSVSNEGNVEHQNCKGIRRLHKNSSGYLSFTIGNKLFLAHRLVALAHVDNPHNKLFVNHKDGDKLNINATNLEWVTKSENELHSVRVLGNQRNIDGFAKNWKNSVNNRKVALFTLNGDLICTFDSCVKAANYLKVSPSSVGNHLKGRTKTTANHTLRYVSQKYKSNKVKYESKEV